MIKKTVVLLSCVEVYSVVFTHHLVYLLTMKIHNAAATSCRLFIFSFFGYVNQVKTHMQTYHYISQKRWGFIPPCRSCISSLYCFIFRISLLSFSPIFSRSWCFTFSQSCSSFVVHSMCFFHCYIFARCFRILFLTICNHVFIRFILYGKFFVVVLQELRLECLWKALCPSPPQYLFDLHLYTVPIFCCHENIVTSLHYKIGPFSIQHFIHFIP